jgi:putative tricarboxylic transport membrane protein
VLLLILNLPMVGLWVKLLSIPRPLLYAGILVFATLGAYGLRNSWFDLALLYGIGLVGFAMRRYDIPVAPTIVGLILGPMAETQMRRALAISQGDPSVFFTQPISATVLAITAAAVIVPRLLKRRRTFSPTPLPTITPWK